MKKKKLIKKGLGTQVTITLEEACFKLQEVKGVYKIPEKTSPSPINKLI